ncbi:MAG: exo-alpha-sialidase [Nitrospira sp.]|nr:exo-alpha-sialidase [Nitrospira sp.]
MKSVAIIWIFIVFFLSGVSWGKEQVKTGPVDIILEPILSSEWACYIQDGDLYIRSIDNILKIRSSKEAAATIFSPDLKVIGNFIFITWIEKGQGGNKVLFTASHDNGKTTKRAIELSANTTVMQVRLYGESRRRLYIIEALSGKEIEVYVNLSIDGGETFKRIPLSIDGLEFLYNPKPVIVDDTLYMFFSGVVDGKKHVGVKSFEAPSMKPKEYNILEETAEVSFMETLYVRVNPAAIYKTTREDKFVLEGVVKGDEGWEAFSIKGAEGLDVARMDYYAWEDGRVLIVFSGEERGKFKQRIYAAISEDDGKNWDVRRIDKKEFDNTRSWLPRLSVDGDRVAVVWEDSRDIRSGIRMKLSTDRGKTWMERDVPVSSGKHYALRPMVSFSRGALYVAYHQFRDDEKKVADLFMEKLRWDDAIKMASKKERGISLKKKEALLRERVNAYWKGMINKDLKTTYGIHDPFYRARIPFNYYSSHRGPMVYHSFSIEDVKIEGNVAIVKLKVKYEVSKLTILGKETSIPPKEIVAEDTYLFIDDTWYRKFVDVMSGGSAIDY